MMDCSCLCARTLPPIDQWWSDQHVPDPSPGSAPTTKARQKSEAKAKRSYVKVGKARRSRAEEKEQKRHNEREARSDIRLCFARAWQECLNTNPNFLEEGVTWGGGIGLTTLKSNNVMMHKDNSNPCNVKKQDVLNLQTICHRQFRQIILDQIDKLRELGHPTEALELQGRLGRVGTNLHSVY